MRFLKFFSVAFVIVVSVLGSVFLINRNVFLAVYENRDAMQEGLEFVEQTYSLLGLTQFMENHPQYVSVVSFEIDNPESGIFFQADTMRTLGYMANFFILVEYARQVDSGKLNPAELHTLEDIEKFLLPGIRETSHENAIRNMRRQGGIERNNIALKDVIGLVIYNNSMPAADYLFHLLGPKNVNNTIKELAGDNAEPFQAYISLQRHLIKSSGDIKSHFENIKQANRTTFIDENLAWFERFRTDEVFAQQWRETAKNTNINLRFAEERKMYRSWPKATPRALAGIMEKLATNTLINEEVSSIVRSYMDWPMADRTTRRNLREYGALYDNRISHLSGIDFGRSVYTDQTFAQVVVFENLPVGFWLHMSSNFMNQDYQKRLIFDPELFRISAEKFNM